ncbi:SCP2 sterol-binding domain-containing protein [Pseudoalteromonas sp. OOF1S-7]|uniref:ubiquinone anaerobic biosynthesis accessory factor UbiT n=1 Tax=Pseudoalteromonas sp. OOF1S-7 TaxID=2917757 RepID=UPI0023B79789|nr:SCP2 sterol-binding domain-containing protein [Pseudoalteromonas sp. OOF1S-7]
MMNSFNDIFKQKTSTFFTPKWLSRLTYIMPCTAMSAALEFHLNNIFKTQITSGELSFLVDKCICIDVNNISLSLFISLDNETERLTILVIKSAFIAQKMTRFDGKLTGSSDALLQLLAGKRDPDTLFFRRELAIEGDTELCLEFKNWLDTQDPEGKLPSRLYADLQSYVETLS